MHDYNNEPCFSLHTLEIRLRCNSQDYYLAYERLRWHCKKNKIFMYDDSSDYVEDVPIGALKEEIICRLLEDRGIIIKLVRCKLNDSPIYYGAWMIINPRRFLGDSTYVGIFDVSRADELLNRLDMALISVGIAHLPISNFTLHRIDLCRNVFLSSQKMVENYIDLLKRCFIPNGFMWNEVGGVEYAIRLKDGIKISNNSLSIVAYNKKAQMVKQGDYYSIVDIEEATGLLRFEIQLFTGRLNYICRGDKSIKRLCKFLHICQTESRKHFEAYIPKVFLMGDYYYFDDAKNIILRSDYYEPTKEKMLTLLVSVSTHRNLMVALDDVLQKYKPSNPYNFVRSLIKCFDELYLNPVTIPRRWNLAGEIFMPGAFKKVMGIDTVFVSTVD